eukprot:963798-Prymnesium_polylepis.1
MGPERSGASAPSAGALLLTAGRLWWGWLWWREVRWLVRCANWRASMRASSDESERRRGERATQVPRTLQPTTAEDPRRSEGSKS